MRNLLVCFAFAAALPTAGGNEYDDTDGNDIIAATESWQVPDQTETVNVD